MYPMISLYACRLFLSTLSLRRATAFLPADRMSHQEFLSTLSLRRATAHFYTVPAVLEFLSTLSLRRATVMSENLTTPSIISIHALLAESDCSVSRLPRRGRISIHALLAESDRLPTALRTPHQRFLSTLSLRRATAKVHKTVGHFCAYETNFMGIASSC